MLPLVDTAKATGLSRVSVRKHTKSALVKVGDALDAEQAQRYPSLVDLRTMARHLSAVMVVKEAVQKTLVLDGSIRRLPAKYAECITDVLVSLEDAELEIIEAAKDSRGQLRGLAGCLRRV